MNQNLLHFGQHILLLALYSLIILGLLGGLDFTGTFMEAIVLATISLTGGGLLSWVSGMTFLKKFNFWNFKYCAVSTGILFIIFVATMITSA